MKKITSFLLAFILVLNLVICNGINVYAEELEEQVEEYVEVENESVDEEETTENPDYFSEDELYEADDLDFSSDIETFDTETSDIETVEETDLSTASTNNITTAAIDNIRNKYGYAAGKYWTYKGSENKTKYTASTTAAGTNGYQGYSYGGGVQCWAFARYLMTQVTGEYVGEGKWKKISAGNVTSLQVGDVVCVGDTVHTAVVYKDLGGGKFQFIEVWGSYGNKIVIGGYNGSSSRNTLASIKSYGLQYVYRWNGTLGPTVTNVKTSTDSNGATVECDVINPSGLNSITMTAWVAADGWQNGKYVTYKPISSSGSHYKFRVNISDLNNKRGAWRSNIFINGEVNYGWFEYTIPEPSNSMPQGMIDVIESTGTNKIHIRGWAYDPDIKSKSLDIHVYVGGTASPSVPCYPIKANKERKDVNKVYGCGDYHGIDETITVSKTGTVSVYVYAIDGNGVNANPMIGSKTITMHTHKYDSGVVTKKATCTSDGVKTFTCSCGNKKTESIPKTGHKWDSWKVTTPATKNANGVETRVCKNDGTHKETRSIPKLKQYIKAKCQMPYQGKGGGWLIGFETYDNPNNSYQYEMLILDCNLYVQGLPAWTYTTGKCGSTGNALWTIWQPQYGYYWTLFRVYDKNGNLLDEECYGFANVF